ncbi:uncharacterized protein LOC117583396 isoform X1 [Drosophila guanche]|uniref:Uncharacterized protein n=1 Tax=Drosophila guanche TaxID=7266 RepID=A0A3B0JD66_DROGU|nr:uncharacterized protein LOC117583396 isoform X1 [Drosophila guanche]SPP80337.1 Hypothetical predicted protein [Drosophila guanche]
MESTNENEHDDASVLAPTPLGKQSGRTHKDTPLAMKTRHGRKKSQANPELGSPTNPEPPKTPPSSRRIMTKNETPRRSARKSVRPALDYDDIMLRSATKEMKNKVTEVIEEIEEPTQKWTAAEVGRNSCKRSRKSRRASSKPKTILGEKDKEVVKPDAAEEPEDTSTEKKDSKSGTEDEDEQCLISVGVQHITADETDEEAVATTKQAVLADTEEKAVEINAVSTAQAPQAAPNDTTLDDLGLCPLEPMEQSEHAAFEDEFECEMPSLIMIDDDELAEPDKSVLNTTFDAEERKSNESNVVAVEIADSDASVKPSIKVVLTTADDQNQTLLTLDEIGTKSTKPSPNRSKINRLPTPYKSRKSSSRKSPKTGKPTQLANTEMRKRRSNSATTWDDIKSRTVSFRSPLEIAHVDDIDKRWERLNTSNVTNRRKRSMSVDEIRPKGSRIPQPKFFKGSQVITPSKVKMRTKLPNFAAIHQKQFAKMENLVDHLDRKAVRAKVLTSSALKHEPGAGSTVKKMPSSSAVAAGDCSRPRALRKIDWCNPTAAKQPENELHEPPRPATSAKVPSQSRLPLKSGSNIVSKPAFNLSTNVVKKFTATSTATTVPTGFEDKVAERRQRHMEMFKSRSAPKEKTGQFIRGVRLNRRFELQMQHRRHMEEE